jgi:hypothetical protein
MVYSFDIVSFLDAISVDSFRSMVLVGILESLSMTGGLREAALDSDAL